MPDEIAIMKLGGFPYELSVPDAMLLVTTEDGDRLEYYMELVNQLQGLLNTEEFTTARAGKVAGNWYVGSPSRCTTLADALKPAI